MLWNISWCKHNLKFLVTADKKAENRHHGPDECKKTLLCFDLSGAKTSLHKNNSLQRDGRAACIPQMAAVTTSLTGGSSLVNMKLGARRTFSLVTFALPLPPPLKTFPLRLCRGLRLLNHHRWQLYPQNNHTALWLCHSYNSTLTAPQPQLLANKPPILWLEMCSTRLFV